MENTRRICLTESTKHRSRGLTDPEVKITELSVLVGLLTVGFGISLTLIPPFMALFFLLVCPFQPGYEDLCLELL